MEVGLSSTIVTTIAVIAGVIWWCWRVLNWLWLRPKRLERCLREQGLRGNSYRLLHGDTDEHKMMVKLATSGPINLSDDICLRVVPFYHHLIEKFGKNSFTWVGPEPRLNIMEPELIKEILLKMDTFKKPIPNPLARLLISGVPFYNGEKWEKHRKIVNPAFHMEKLKNMLPAMHLSCSEMMNKWEMLVPENSCRELDVHPDIETLTADVISRTAFGSSYEEGRRIFQLQKEQGLLTRQVVQSVYIPGWRFLPTKINKRMKGIDKELLADDDLMGMLLKSKNYSGMSFEDVMEECKAFYLAGQESTSNLLAWTLVLLSFHQKWQVRAREEVLQIFGNNKPGFEGLNHLKIVTMILNEVMRLYPPGVIMLRTIHKATKLGKMTISPGVQFVVPIILIHHDRGLWGEDAKEFKPERFSEGIAKATRGKLSYFPFSWGPRICVGNNFALLEAKLALSMILQRFSFELSPSYAHAPTFIITLRPQHGVHLTLRRALPINANPNTHIK
ncbi:Secologanin synthase [Bertholletia excelsa]